MALLFASTFEPAGSTASQQSEKYSLYVYSGDLLQPGNFVCLGETIKIYVEARWEITHPDGSRQINRLSGIPITATPGRGTGTIIPRRAFINVFHKRPETALFTFKADKEGHEVISFEAVVPGLLFPLAPNSDYASDDTYVLQQFEFEVKKCRLGVNLIYDGQYADDAFYASELGVIEDAIIEQDDSGVYRGSADFEWNVFNHATNDGECVWEPYSVVSQTEITARPDDENDSLGLTITYSDVQHSVTATCAGLGTTTVDSASLLSQTGPTTATLSSSGGVVTFGQAWPGEFGKFTIIVEPEEEQPAVSRTSDPVAWLLDWLEVVLLLHVNTQ